MTGSTTLAGNHGQQKKPVIACFPLYPPLELFHCMGLNPMILWDLKARIQDTQESDAHLQTFTCSVARALTQFLLADEAPGFDALFMYNACDTLRNLPEIIQAGLAGKGRSIPIFRLHIPTLALDQPHSAEYLQKGIKGLIQEIEAYFQVRFDPKNFSSSAFLYRHMRRQYRQLETQVAHGRLDFAVFNQLCCSGRHLPDTRHLAELAILAGPEHENQNALPAGAPQPRVLLSGILPPPPAVIQAMEKTGLCIAGNDLANLSRSYLADMEPLDDPVAYYTGFYSQHPPCPTLLPSADSRIPHLLGLVHSRKADGIIWIGEKYCEYEYLEMPFLEKQLKQKNIPLLQLECGLDDKENIGALKTRIEAFAELLRSSHGSIC